MSDEIIERPLIDERDWKETSPHTLDVGDMDELDPRWKTHPHHQQEVFYASRKSYRKSTLQSINPERDSNGEFKMTRKRLTNKTLASVDMEAKSVNSARIAMKLLGEGCTDAEAARMGSILNSRLAKSELDEITMIASRVAMEEESMGAASSADMESDGQPDPRDSQTYVEEHELDKSLSS